MVELSLSSDKFCNSQSHFLLPSLTHSFSMIVHVSEPSSLFLNGKVPHFPFISNLICNKSYEYEIKGPQLAV